MDSRLFQAASNGDLQFLEKLTDPNTLLQVTTEKNTVLHVAVQFNQLEAARKIVHLNSRLVYEANSKGNTPLHVAAREGSSSLVKLLIELEKEQVQDIEKGRQHQLLRKVNGDGDTALHVVARNYNFQSERELVNEDPELAKYENRTAFCILDAAPEYCSYAGRHMMNVDDAEKSPVSHTVLAHSKQDLHNKKRRPNREHRYIERGCQHQLLRKVNGDGDTALHVVARNYNFQSERELVNEDPELAKYENRTAFCILDAAPKYCSYAGRHMMNVDDVEKSPVSHTVFAYSKQDLHNKKRRPNREHRCGAGQIPSEGQVRTILTTLEC